MRRANLVVARYVTSRRRSKNRRLEDLLSALASQVGLVDRLVEIFVRASGYSLAVGLGVSSVRRRGQRAGILLGPFVEGEQALLTLILYGSAFLLLSGWLLHRREVA